MTLQDAQRHIDSFPRPNGFDLNAWRVYKKTAMMIWKSYLSGQSWEGTVKIPCREYFFMLHDKQGKLILGNGQVVWLDNEWNQELVKRLELRGIEHSNVGAWDYADAYFTRALRINPNCASCLNHRGWTRQQTGNFKAALEDYTSAIAINPADDSAYVNRAALWSLLDEDSKAMDDLNKAIALNPNNGEAYSQRGFILKARNDEDAANDNLNRAAELTQNSYLKVA